MIVFPALCNVCQAFKLVMSYTMESQNICKETENFLKKPKVCQDRIRMIEIAKPDSYRVES
ncbi:hypothetical protein LBWT_31240 [Leptolyngbya boryana IAM M-101]|nr:hypothetical protein LBWT_31240 [Leptolyngbya boryana IAM M-101]BAS63519.1 hypothetical protein LBDG_31240 [Leptolyngbya boryana dg5]